MQNKIHLKVDVDWGSTGVWVNHEGWGNADSQDFPIPSWLVERFKFWCDWYNSSATASFNNEKETAAKLEAYKLSLAIDLRRVLDLKYVVYVWDDIQGRNVEITQSYD